MFRSPRSTAACTALLIASAARAWPQSSLKSVASSIDASRYAASAASASSPSFAADDAVANKLLANTIAIDLGAKTAALDDAAAVPVTAAGLSLAGSTIALDANGLCIVSRSKESVIYALKGRLSGSLPIDSAADYQLYLDGAAIKAVTGPAIASSSMSKVDIVTAKGTADSLADSKERVLTQKAALYSKGALVFSGSGSLSIEASY